MIKVIDGLPSDTIGFEAVGEVEADDYTSVLEPALETALETNDKVRVLYVIGNEFTGYSSGAKKEDMKVAKTDKSKFEKIALVTDHKSYVHAVKAFAWMLPCPLKAFAVADLDDAKVWLAT